jgi:MYXO-CTERM domain-containing protein
MVHGGRAGSRFGVAAVAALIGGVLSWPDRAVAVMVPFEETFSANAAGWVVGLVPSGTGSPTWASSGGVSDSGFISMSRTMSASQFTGSGFGFIAFRGNAAADASGDAFVGNWLAAGVSEVSASVRHNAPAALNLYLRLDAGGGAAASSVVFSVPSNTWTKLAVPIVDGTTSFQSYGAGTFNAVFSNIQNVQVALWPTQPAEVLDGTTTYTFGLDGVAVVPEPSAIAIATAGLGAAVAWRRRRAVWAASLAREQRSRSA